MFQSSDNVARLLYQLGYDDLGSGLSDLDNAIQLASREYSKLLTSYLQRELADYLTISELKQGSIEIEPKILNEAYWISRNQGSCQHTYIWGNTRDKNVVNPV
jgi:hypothetical protein